MCERLQHHADREHCLAGALPDREEGLPFGPQEALRGELLRVLRVGPRRAVVTPGVLVMALRGRHGPHETLPARAACDQLDQLRARRLQGGVVGNRCMDGSKRQSQLVLRRPVRRHADAQPRQGGGGAIEHRKILLERQFERPPGGGTRTKAFDAIDCSLGGNRIHRGRRIEAAHAVTRLAGFQYLALLPEQRTHGVERRQLRGPRFQPPQSGLHAERHGDLAEIEVHEKRAPAGSPWIVRPGPQAPAALQRIRRACGTRRCGCRSRPCRPAPRRSARRSRSRLRSWPASGSCPRCRP